MKQDKNFIGEVLMNALGVCCLSCNTNFAQNELKTIKTEKCTREEMIVHCKLFTRDGS